MSISIRAIIKSGLLVLAVLASGVMVGCGADGEGTIKISDPAKLRAQAGGGAGTPPARKESAKQAKARALDEEAAKKHPKLQ